MTTIPLEETAVPEVVLPPAPPPPPACPGSPYLCLLVIPVPLMFFLVLGCMWYYKVSDLSTHSPVAQALLNPNKVSGLLAAPGSHLWEGSQVIT